MMTCFCTATDDGTLTTTCHVHANPILQARLDEREACAKIADAYAREARGMTEEEAAAEAIAKLIRART